LFQGGGRGGWGRDKYDFGGDGSRRMGKGGEKRAGRGGGQRRDPLGQNPFSGARGFRPVRGLDLVGWWRVWGKVSTKVGLAHDLLFRMGMRRALGRKVLIPVLGAWARSDGGGGGGGGTLSGSLVVALFSWQKRAKKGIGGDRGIYGSGRRGTGRLKRVIEY